MYEVSDDSGFLALIDPDAYHGFVAKEWEFEQLMAHFMEQMALGRLLIWGTGAEGYWRVDVRTAPGTGQPFREVTGPITATKGRLLLSSYERLTMAAAYADVTLPEDHDRDLLLPVPPGGCECRVLQLFDPDDFEESEGEGPDFALELSNATPGTPPWPAIPWSEL